MVKLPDRKQQLIARILKVNHAGEHGAIRIYGAQIAVSKLFHRDIVAQLQEMKRHEVEHHRQFSEAMKKRAARPCRLLFLWAWGGGILGFTTALLGQRMIWICTEAVEDAVHHHLTDQLRFLKQNDEELHSVIKAIQIEEQSHLDHAIRSRGTKNAFAKLAVATIAIATDVLIWMSTSGDSSRLKRDLPTAS